MPLEGADLERAIELSVEMNQRITKEQRASNMVKYAELMGDKDRLESAMTEGKVRFDAADKDGDGRLNEEEWLTYAQGESEHALSKGWEVAPWDETAKAQCIEAYGLQDKISEGTGISWEDLTWNIQNVGAPAHARIVEMDK